MPFRTLARRWVAVAASVAALGATAGGLRAAGRASRTFRPAAPVGSSGPEVLLLRTNAAVARAWRSRGLRGRVVLHAGRFLHFVEDGAPAQEAFAGAGSGRRIDSAVAAAAGPRSHLWVAAATGIARRVHYLIPPRALSERLATIPAQPSALPLAVDDEAHPRTVDGAPPRLSEPVLLDVNASWFDEAEGTELLALLREAGTTTDLVTLSLGEGNDDVSDGARERLRAFAAMLD